ncbi:MAG: glycosyltransferase family 2 protein [Candidatus Hydrogenedentes bacterium]|nr:glycosyltransferase family 2 protein [Candidatus Hydrogenedentota bacterium]
MTADVVIVSYNTRDLLRACLASVFRYGGAPLRAVFVVDNASGDGSAAMVQSEFPAVRLIALDENLGFGAANNRAIRASAAEALLFLNPDAELTQGALDALLHCLEMHAQCVLVGPKLVYPGGRFQASCRRFPTPLRACWSLTGMEARFPERCACLRNWLREDEHRSGARVDMVSGACFLARRDFVARVGGFDEECFLYEEETDLMLPARKEGAGVRYCPEAVVVHHGGASVAAAGLSVFSLRHLYRSKYYCFRKHYGLRAARRAYRLDCAVLALSAARQRLRGSREAADRLREVRRAWRDSFTPISVLRAQADFRDS